jgi:peptidoglycan/LPS O-acetylase OafA/YrhL
MDRAFTGAVPYFRHAAEDQLTNTTSGGQHAGVTIGTVVMALGGGKTPEQRRAVVRTAVILGAIVLAIYLYTVIRGFS